MDVFIARVNGRAYGFGYANRGTPIDWVVCVSRDRRFAENALRRALRRYPKNEMDGVIVQVPMESYGQYSLTEYCS